MFRRFAAQSDRRRRDWHRGKCRVFQEPLVANLVRFGRRPRHRMVELPSRLRVAVRFARKKGPGWTGYSRKTRIQHHSTAGEIGNSRFATSGHTDRWILNFKIP
ncbi:hypothetical protein L5515_015727 [Caenorhabditis briggsae]|uniref:Uncharacterized protein n=1 Tax=Caenorhabditis briggsae TaxID=6238 RepID=A0AAE9J8H4_CAEBR|nr:hypothetical protein L5515_015727 [Caenorhabditis briggsae]